MKYGAALMVAIGMAGIGFGQGEPGQGPTESEPALRAARDDMRAACQGATLVVARVEKVHASPGIWCGILVTKQVVTWHVVEKIQGDDAGQTLEIGHLLVHGHPLVEREEPFLMPDRIYPGARAVLALARKGADWDLPEGEHAMRLVDPPRPLHPDHLSIFTQALRCLELRPYADDRPEAENSVITVELGGALTIPFRRPGKPLLFRFVPPEMVGNATPWKFERLQENEGRMELFVRIPKEGVRATLHFEGGPGKWTLTKADVAEH